MKREILPTMVLLLALLAIQPSPVAAKIQNGGFETGSFKSGEGVNVHTMSLPPGPIAIDGWTVEGAEVSWIEIGNTYININPASNGNRILDLTGFHDQLPFGAVRQTVSGLARGLTYEISLDLGTLQNRTSLSGPIAVDVTVESGTTTTNHCTSNPPQDLGVVWERCTFRFVAGAPDTTIHITGQSGNKYIGLDNVSLTYVSPIPSWVNQFVVLAIAILLTFLLILIFIIRRRSARGA